jgi:hypothetical protein
MENAHDDQYVVFVRWPRGYQDPPEDSEHAVITCDSYEEACRVRQKQRARARDCVIRFLGDVGGGD